MQKITIDVSKITNADTFHDVFDEALGFPGWYGRNMDAWIDCMTNVDESPSLTSKVNLKPGGMIVLELENIKVLRDSHRELYDDLIECAAFVNWRRLEKGDDPVLILSFYA